MMIEFVTMNGTAVRVTECRPRTVALPDGTSLTEVDLIVILRGQPTHETFLALLEQRPLLLEIPPDQPALEMTVAGSDWVLKSGAYRHELTLREVSVSDEESPPPIESTGSEAERVGLRLEALIDALDRAGVVSRSAVNDAYLRLLVERFVAEATPVVGEVAAAPATRDGLGS